MDLNAPQRQPLLCAAIGNLEREVGDINAISQEILNKLGLNRPPSCQAKTEAALKSTATPLIDERIDWINGIGNNLTDIMAVLRAIYENISEI